MHLFYYYTFGFSTILHYTYPSHAFNSKRLFDFKMGVFVLGAKALQENHQRISRFSQRTRIFPLRHLMFFDTL